MRAAFAFCRSHLTEHTCVFLTSPGVGQDQKANKQNCSSVPYSHGALVCVAAVGAGAVRVRRESDRDRVLLENCMSRRKRERRGGGGATQGERNDAGGGRNGNWPVVKMKQRPTARVLQAHSAGGHERGQVFKLRQLV